MSKYTWKKVHLRVKRVPVWLCFKPLVSESAGWVRVSRTEKVWGFRGRKRTAEESRERERQKRERVISPHPASFLFKHRVKLCHSLLQPLPSPSPFFCYPSSLSVAPSITYSLLLFSSLHHSPPLISSLHTYSIYYSSNRRGNESVQLPENHCN